nr:MAG TPA: hypothetical protein [Caudoviricetes sp.]
MVQKSHLNKQFGFLNSEILIMLLHFSLTDSRRQREL